MSDEYEEILILWNSFAKKKANKEDVIIASAVNYTSTYIGKDVFLECVKNYKKACELPESQVWHFNLFNFAKRGYIKFMPGAFDIDNYDKSKLQKKDKKLVHLRCKCGRITTKEELRNYKGICSFCYWENKKKEFEKESIK